MVKCFWRVLAVACLIGVSVAVPAASIEGNAEGRNLGRNSIQTDDLLDNIYSDCLRKDSVSCVKYKLFSYMDKVLTSKDTFSLGEGVKIVQNGNNDGSPRSIDDEKTDDVETMLVNRVERFLETHTLKFDLKGTDVLNAVSNAGRAIGDALGVTEPEDTVEEARGKKKKAQKMLLPILLAFKLKAASLIPLALGAIALIAGKALIIGKIALILAAIIGLKKLLHHQKSVTYEIVSHPHHSSSHSTHEGWSGGDFGSSGSGGHGGWGRSSNDAQNMAYKAYQPAAQQ